MERGLGLVALVAAAACANTSPWVAPTTLDTRDDPATLRPGHGNAELHTWWPVAAPELGALQGIDRARQGDARALLALAILASGDHRDAASYATFQDRVDRFTAELRPTLDAAADDWHRGYELHRAMHRVFFGGERTELGSYDFNQMRVTGIFTSGRYNCLSSAMLFLVLARGFGLPVRAVIVPTHVFVEMGPPGGKTIEIETTSPTGFDWVHDERFYREEAGRWSNNRGLRPVTLEEYQHRTIVEPYRLMATALLDGRLAATDRERLRFYELAALIDPDDVEAARDRVQSYVNEAVDLYEARAWRTMVKLFDTVAPVIDEIGGTTRDGKTQEAVSWANWNYAHALMIVGRTDQAMARTNAGLDKLDTGWPDADKLKINYLALLDDRLGELIAKKDYPGALQAVIRHRDVCRADKICAGNIGVVYGNWSIEHQNAGDWQSARQVLQECVSVLPGDSRCRDALTDLESRHRF